MIELGRVFTSIDHRLYREDHSCLHFWSTISLSLMIDIGFLMELYSDAMTCVVTYDGTSFRFGIFRYLIADISEEISWLHLFNPDLP